MLHLTVTAPGGKKAEIDCAETSSFGDVKVRLTEILGVPVEKQRLLCAGKERKDNNEKLAAAGVTAKSKLMLMLVPGYKMPESAPQPAAGSSGYKSEEMPKPAMEESPPKVLTVSCLQRMALVRQPLLALCECAGGEIAIMSQSPRGFMLRLLQTWLNTSLHKLRYPLTDCACFVEERRQQLQIFWATRGQRK